MPVSDEFWGRMTSEETYAHIEAGFYLLTKEEQIKFIVSMMREDPEYLGDEVLLTFESEAKALYE